MAKKLTAISVQNEAPGNARKEIADTGCTGLYLVVQPSGARSWALRYRYLDKPRKLTLGPVLTVANGEAEPGEVEIGRPLTLAAARKLAQDELHKLKLGRDPAADKNTALLQAGLRQFAGRPIPSRRWRHASSSSTSERRTGHPPGSRLSES